MKTGWTVKETAEKTGIPADTLRYYDKEGIVSPKRSEGGYRLYDDRDISYLKNIVVMKYAHFTLSEIKSMETLFAHEAGIDCNEISKGILNAKILELRQAINNYQKIVALMEELLPMIDCVASYKANGKRIDGFIGQIFDDIRKEPPLLNEGGGDKNEKENE